MSTSIPWSQPLYRSLDDLIEYVPDGSLLVLRSTLYPGITRLINDRIRRAETRNPRGLLP